MTTHLVLVPGFWLGAWAWESVLPHLQRSDVRVTALTLPGLESLDADRSAVTFDSHVRAVIDAVNASGDRTVLVVHSGAGPVGYAVTDRIPERIARIVYVDSGPMPDGAALRPDLADDVTEIPLPTWAQLESEGSSLDGLDADMLAAFRAGAIPEPAGPAREPVALRDERRFSVPATAICSSFSLEMIAQMTDAGHPIGVEFAKLPTTFVDLPTGHWPMWPRPKDLAACILDAADA
ncbi:alpha/beta fold hydrolase [Rhodococcus sp. 27YEA15]|uniref:alpha/beta fold hydrolase n=1 Tax=Rhodococcus sp. 27YEA15 TaxID=3156259 RepID=UPI003C7C4D29